MVRSDTEMNGITGKPARLPAIRCLSMQSVSIDVALVFDANHLLGEALLLLLIEA